jgi:hypothetical protein
VAAKLADTRELLKTLPELPQNVELEVRQSLRSFFELVKAGLRSPEFEGKYQDLCESFRRCLAGMKPKVLVTDPTDHQVIVIDDDKDMTSPASPAPKRPHSDMAPPQTPSKRQRVNGAMSAAQHVNIEDGSSSRPNSRQSSATPSLRLGRKARPGRQ